MCQWFASPAFLWQRLAESCCCHRDRQSPPPAQPLGPSLEKASGTKLGQGEPFPIREMASSGDSASQKHQGGSIPFHSIPRWGYCVALPLGSMVQRVTARQQHTTLGQNKPNPAWSCQEKGLPGAPTISNHWLGSQLQLQRASKTALQGAARRGTSPSLAHPHSALLRICTAATEGATCMSHGMESNRQMLLSPTDLPARFLSDLGTGVRRQIGTSVTRRGSEGNLPY